MNHKRPTTGSNKRKRIKLDMRNGAVGIGGYPTVVTALPVYSKSGELHHYRVTNYTYTKHISNDDLVCATSNGVYVINGDLP